MFGKRESKIRIGRSYLLRSLLAILMVPFLISGTFLSRAAPVTGQGTEVQDPALNALSAPIKSPSQTYQLSVSTTGSGSVSSNPEGIDCGSNCAFYFDESTVVTLTATSTPGWSFYGWNGDLDGSTNLITTTMDASKSVTATFTLNQYALTVDKLGTGTGTVTSNPAGIVCGGVCSNDYDYGTVITLTAAADTGSAFRGWTGATCSGTANCVVTISAAETVTATFNLQHQLTVNKDGNGSGTVTSNPPGINCGATCANNFDASTVVTLTAAADTFSAFTGWGGVACPGTGDCVVTMSTAKTVTATFTLNQYTLTVDKLGTGTGTVTSNPPGIVCGGDCTHDYDYGTVITLTAAADTGSVFRGWTGATCSGTGNCVVTISAAETVTATFNLQHQLTVNKDGNGSGTVTSNPPGIDCGATCANNFDASTVVTLTATVDTGSAFTGWGGVACPGTGDCVVTMSTAKTVTATFTLSKYTLSVSNTGSGSVSSNPAGIDCGASCDYDYDYNTIVTLTATPASGWSFFGWEDDLAGNTNPITITMDGNKSVTAVFKQYFVFLPSVRRDPIFADDFNYSSELVANKWEIVPDPALPANQNATWTTLNSEFHGKHTVADHNSKAVAKVYSPEMPGSYSVVANMKLATGSVDAARGGLLFDFKDNTRTYRFVIMPGVTTGDNWLVQKLVSGSWTVISDGHGRATNMLPKDQYNLLRVARRVDGSIKVYLNNVQLWSGNDLTYQYGRAGLNIGTPVVLGTGAYVEVIFDDFVIDSLP